MRGIFQPSLCDRLPEGIPKNPFQSLIDLSNFHLPTSFAQDFGVVSMVTPDPSVTGLTLASADAAKIEVDGGERIFVVLMVQGGPRKTSYKWCEIYTVTGNPYKWPKING